MARKIGRALSRPHVKFLAKRVGQRKDKGLDQPYQEFTDVCVFNTVGITDLYMIKRKLAQGWKIIDFCNFPDETGQRFTPYKDLINETSLFLGAQDKANVDDADYNNYERKAVSVKSKSQQENEKKDRKSNAQANTRSS